MNNMFSEEEGVYEGLGDVFKIGDYVNVDKTGEVGEVTAVSVAVVIDEDTRKIVRDTVYFLEDITNGVPYEGQITAHSKEVSAATTEDIEEYIDFVNYVRETEREFDEMSKFSSASGGYQLNPEEVERFAESLLRAEQVDTENILSEVLKMVERRTDDDILDDYRDARDLASMLGDEDGKYAKRMKELEDELRTRYDSKSE